MIYCFDLDGTICESEKDDKGASDYKNATCYPGAVEKLNELFDAGHTIIIHTARHMVTCENNVQEVERKMRKLTEDWLKEHQINYHSLIFGKPYADIYIDDKGFKFENNWHKIK